jgi:hypothetical protein
MRSRGVYVPSDEAAVHVQLVAQSKAKNKLEQELKSATTSRNMIVMQLREAEKAAR